MYLKVDYMKSAGKSISKSKISSAPSRKGNITKSMPYHPMIRYPILMPRTRRLVSDFLFQIILKKV